MSGEPIPASLMGIGYPYGVRPGDTYDHLTDKEILDQLRGKSPITKRGALTPKGLIERLRALANAGVDLAQKKNEDYATETDPWKNFRSAEIYGVPVERAMLIRMADKMARISTLLSKPPSVEDESVLDTLTDLANYALLLRIWLEEKNDELRG